MSSPSRWWYGVASFPSVVLAALLVLACLALDVQALRTEKSTAWTPSLAWTFVGLAHLLGAAFAPPLLAPVPVLSYYVYRRYGDARQTV